MDQAGVRRAVAAARTVVTSAGLTADDAIVLQNSNRLAVRLLPCDVLVRIESAQQQNAAFEVDLAQRLAAADCPIGVLDPRVEPVVHRLDGFMITLWTFYEPLPGQQISPADYADALQRLHAGMRTVEVPTPHFLDRVASAEELAADRDRTPDLPDADRELLGSTLQSLRHRIGERSDEQLLHGEPHSRNLLASKDGPLFIDLETACRGPVEFDLAHAPDEVADHYSGADQQLLRQCRILMRVMIIMWRWDRDDQLPDGRRLAAEWIGEVRTALDREDLDPSR